MRRDDIDAVYKRSGVLGKNAAVFFWANIIFTAIALIPALGGELVSTVQIITAFLFLFVSVTDDCICWYDAERERRKNNIENAFGIDVSELKTEGYYNNSISPSLLKFIVNGFESVFLTVRILAGMLRSEVLKVAAVIILIIMSLRFADMNILQIVLEGALSAYLLNGSIMIMVFYFRVKGIYEKLYSLLISEGCVNEKQTALAFVEALEYEACKAHYKVRLSTKLFNKMNKALSAEWEAIEKRIVRL